MATQKSLIMRFLATVSAGKFFISYNTVSKDHREYSLPYLCVADDSFWLYPIPVQFAYHPGVNFVSMWH